jgi:hypothetical protein
MCLCYTGTVFTLHRNCVCYTGTVFTWHRNCVCYTRTVFTWHRNCLLHRNCGYFTQELCLLHRNCVYSCKNDISHDLFGPTNFTFGTQAVCTLCCHIHRCFSLPMIHLTDQGFDDQCPDPEECHFCCNLDRSSMTRLLDILINSYGRMRVLNTVELHLSGTWLTRLAWPMVNLLRILKTNMPWNYRLLDQVQ